MSPVFAIWESPVQLMVVGVIALLLFGKRLPEVMRNLGAGMAEFKKGMSGLGEESNRSSYAGSGAGAGAGNFPAYQEPSRPLPANERAELIAPKFQLPVAASASTEQEHANPA